MEKWINLLQNPEKAKNVKQNYPAEHITFAGQKYGLTPETNLTFRGLWSHVQGVSSFCCLHLTLSIICTNTLIIERASQTCLTLCCLYGYWAFTLWRIMLVLKVYMPIQFDVYLGWRFGLCIWAWKLCRVQWCSKWGRGLAICQSCHWCNFSSPEFLLLHDMDSTVKLPKSL